MFGVGNLSTYYHNVIHLMVTIVLLNCFNCIFRHLKLELLTQFPASNYEKYYYLWNIDISNVKLLDQLIN